MSECIHGLEGSWCSLCKGDYKVEYFDAKRLECCAPKCSKVADKRLGALPLCPRHLLSVERRIVRVYKPIYAPRKVTDDGPGWVYFVRIDDAVKIGFSKQPAKRLQSFGVYSLDTKVTLLSLERGDRAKEKRLHRMFSDLRHVVAGKSNELFRPDPAIFNYIQDHRQCSAYTRDDEHCRLRAQPESLTCGHHKNDRSIPPDMYSLYADREIPHEDVA